MPNPPTPINFTTVRKALAREVQRVTGRTCILEEPSQPQAPRPQLPYFSFKLVSPSITLGTDWHTYTGEGDRFNWGGQRKMVVSFHCYGTDQEQAYNLMTLLQASLSTFTALANLRREGMAVWDVGTIADLSQLLNTGYEGRAHMDVSFGIASNLEEDLGSIEGTEITGTVEAGQEEITVGPFEAPGGD